MASEYLTIFAVTEKGEGESKKSYFARIGAAFPHRSGTGFNIILELLPNAGQKLVALPPKEAKAEGAGA